MIISAGVIRARPILLTTLAVVLGSAIMLTDLVFGGLAISRIFGTVISSALTINIVPVLYYRIAKEVSHGDSHWGEPAGNGDFHAIDGK